MTLGQGQGYRVGVTERSDTAPAPGLTIGEAATRSGVTAKAIRLYELKGLLPTAERTDAGYRLFSTGDVAVLCFIRRAKALGLQLSEIKNVLDLQRNGEHPCGQVLQLLDQHLADIDRTITELEQLRSALASARRRARKSQRLGKEAVVCQIIEANGDTR